MQIHIYIFIYNLFKRVSSYEVEIEGIKGFSKEKSSGIIYTYFINFIITILYNNVSSSGLRFMHLAQILYTKMHDL